MSFTTEFFQTLINTVIGSNQQDNQQEDISAVEFEKVKKAETDYDRLDVLRNSVSCSIKDTVAILIRFEDDARRLEGIRIAKRRNKIAPEDCFNIFYLFTDQNCLISVIQELSFSAKYTLPVFIKLVECQVDQFQMSQILHTHQANLPLDSGQCIAILKLFSSEEIRVKASLAMMKYYSLVDEKEIVDGLKSFTSDQYRNTSSLCHYVSPSHCSEVLALYSSLEERYKAWEMMIFGHHVKQYENLSFEDSQCLVNSNFKDIKWHSQASQLLDCL